MYLETSKERSLYDGSLRNDNTEVIYEYYEVSGDEDEDEPVAQKQVDAVTHPPVKQSPSVPRPLPPAPPAPRPQSSPSLPQRPATQQSSSLNIPLSQPSPPAIRPPPSFGQTNSERTLVAQVPLAQVPIQERMQPILTPPPPTTPTPFDPADFEPVVFGITSLPASKFIGIEKPKPAPPQPFQNNNCKLSFVKIYCNILTGKQIQFTVHCGLLGQRGESARIVFKCEYEPAIQW